jgi:hypothetical protein
MQPLRTEGELKAAVDVEDLEIIHHNSIDFAPAASLKHNLRLLRKKVPANYRQQTYFG